jgi:hypothetical protein
MRAAVERALSDADSWYRVYDKLREAVPDGEAERYRALIWGFGYDLVRPEETDRREREGSAFGAMFEFTHGRMPPRLADVPDADVELWAAANDAIADHRSRSRLADLLWSRRFGERPDLAAREAARSLLDLSLDEGWNELGRADGLVRGLEIALELSDQELTGRVTNRITHVTREELELGEDRPGISFTLLRSLVDLPEALRPAELEQLIELSEEVYGSDAFQLDTAIDLRAQLVGPERKRELRSRQVENWRRRAGDAQGLTRLAFLQSALDLARVHGLTQQAESLRVELAELNEEDLDLKVLSAEVQMPTDQIDAHIDSFITADHWRASLTRFGAYGPPGGEPEEIDRRVEQAMNDHPLQYLFQKVVLDSDSGIPVFRASDPDEHKRAARAEHRVFALRFWGHFAGEILRRVEAKCGRPPHNELVEFLTTELIEVGNAETIALGIELWWDGRPNESAHLIAPRLEAVIRGIARDLGLAIVREPERNKPGRVRGLGALMEVIDGRLGTPGWSEYLQSLLCDPLALNLRNVIAHGLREEIASDDTALLIHAACFLALLRGSEQADGSGKQN